MAKQELLKQKEQNRLSFEDGLTTEQMSSFYEAEFNCEYLNKARYGFDNNSTMKQVSIFLQARDQ